MPSKLANFDSLFAYKWAKSCKFSFNHPPVSFFSYFLCSLLLITSFVLFYVTTVSYFWVIAWGGCKSGRGGEDGAGWGQFCLQFLVITNANAMKHCGEQGGNRRCEKI